MSFGTRALIGSVHNSTPPAGFHELWPGANLDPLPVAWTTVAGAAEQNGANGMRFTALGSVKANTGISDGVLTIKFRPDNHYPYIYFRGDASLTHFNQLVIFGSDGHIQYAESADGGATTTNVVNGSTLLTLDGSAVEHTLEIHRAGTSIIVNLDGTLELIATAAVSLGGTYVALNWAVAPVNGTYYFGQVDDV